jgi:U3 small nucleolar RNA-associated protein 14
VGKKQQKCYCGSEKCRGYLGTSDKQSNSLNHIWEDDTSSSSSISEESDSDSSVKKSNNNKPKDYDVYFLCFIHFYL